MGFRFRFFVPLLGTIALALAAGDSLSDAEANFKKPDGEFFEAELAWLAKLGTRVTGSPKHNQLIDRIQHQLESLGLHVYSDTINFTYRQVPPKVPQVKLGGDVLAASAGFPYAGDTTPAGVSGALVALNSPVTDWSPAAGKIAVVNVSNNVTEKGNFYSGVLWPPGTPPPQPLQNLTFISVFALNLTAATAAGARGVVWAWDRSISDGNAYGQYVPFTQPPFDLPSLFVSGANASRVSAAARAGGTATLVTPGKRVPNRPTRSIWVVIPGRDRARAGESVIFDTHTDGVNVIEENGHLVLLARARELCKRPPRRTTVLVFVTGHMRIPAVTAAGQAMTRWLDDHPEYWKGGPGQLKAVVGSGVEHLGALEFHEDPVSNTYTLGSGMIAPEALYAGTSELATQAQKYWCGAEANVTRVINPNLVPMHPGEGGPLFAVGIPDLSLVTVVGYLLKEFLPGFGRAEFPGGFDERCLVDLAAFGRQADSFMRIWDMWDDMSAGEFGVVPNPHG